jgi:AcrR family transcriptional regulator
MARPKTIADADLLDAARAVFVQRGLGASTREIARRAGVSEGVLFQRYATKQELFFAAMVLPAADLSALFRARRGDTRAHVEEAALAITDYFRETMPVLVPLVAHPGFRFEEFARRHPDSPLDALRRGLVSFLADARARGQIGPADPGAAALAVIAIAQCVAFFEHMGAHGGRMPTDLIRRAVDCVWTGLEPEAAVRSARPRPSRPSKPKPSKPKPPRRPSRR